MIEPVVPEPETRVEGEPEGEDDSERSIEKSKLMFTKGLKAALNERYAGDKITVGDRVGEAVTTLADEIKNLRSQLAAKDETVRTLETEAAIGRVYRDDLVREMEAVIIRAASPDEDKEAKVARYRKLADSADIETIKGLRDDFAEAARAKYGVGRRTVETEMDRKDGKKKPALSPSVYDDLPA